MNENYFHDIADLLRRKSTRTMPLADLWQAMLEGMPLKRQRQVFGHGKADVMRRTIKATLRDYAVKTHNHELMGLLDKFADYNPTRADPNSRRQRKLKQPPKPKSNLPPDVQDYLSIIDVIEKAGGAASMAILGKKRRRWLERKPRNPQQPAQNETPRRPRQHGRGRRVGKAWRAVRARPQAMHEFKDKARACGDGPRMIVAGIR